MEGTMCNTLSSLEEAQGVYKYPIYKNGILTPSNYCSPQCGEEGNSHEMYVYCCFQMFHPYLSHHQISPPTYCLQL